MNPLRNLTNLPLEVLILIFKELPSLNEQIPLAQVHPHIGLAFFLHNKQRYKDINIFFLDADELSVVLPICGSSVINVYKHSWKSAVMCDTKLKLLEQHCTNLESIELKVTKENINGVKSLLTKVRSLISINLETEQEVENHVGIVELLKLQPGLRSLKLNNFWGDELFKVRNLVDLEELKIINRWDDILNIHELCYPLKKLRKLKMICMAFTASEEFEGAPCPALRELHLLVWDYLFLKTQCLSTPACLKWIQSHGEILEVLVLDLNFALCKKDVVSQQDICKILSECRKLRSFHMELLAMDSDIAHRIVKIVSENGVTSEERPLELYFHDNEVHDQIKAAMANTSAKNIFTFKDTLLCILKKLKK